MRDSKTGVELLIQEYEDQKQLSEALKVQIELSNRVCDLQQCLLNSYQQDAKIMMDSLEVAVSLSKSLVNLIQEMIRRPVDKENAEYRTESVIRARETIAILDKQIVDLKRRSV